MRDDFRTPAPAAVKEKSHERKGHGDKIGYGVEMPYEHLFGGAYRFVGARQQRLIGPLATHQQRRYGAHDLRQQENAEKDQIIGQCGKFPLQSPDFTDGLRSRRRLLHGSLCFFFCHIACNYQSVPSSKISNVRLRLWISI